MRPNGQCAVEPDSDPVSFFWGGSRSRYAPQMQTLWRTRHGDDGPRSWEVPLIA